MKLVRRIFVVVAVVTLVVAGMIAAFYGVEDWRGARAWAECQRDLRGRGESLEVAAFIPPAVPDDENLAMAPLFVRMYGYRVDPATGLLTFPSPPPQNALEDEITSMPYGAVRNNVKLPASAGSWATGYPLDLAAWQRYYRDRPDFPHGAQPQAAAEDVLLALTKYDPTLDELAQAAAARPRTRFPINWTAEQPAMISLRHYNALQHLTTVLRLRATANLALGHDDAAMRDLALAQRLTSDSAADPILIAQLVSVTQAGLMMQPIWEGLNARQWSGPELERIKNGLRGLDYLAGYQQAIRCERSTFMIKTADYFKTHGNFFRTAQALQNMQSVDENDYHLAFLNSVGDLVPAGWYDQNKAIGCRYFQDDLIDTIDARAHRVQPAARDLGSTVQRLRLTPYTWMLKLSAPVYPSLLIKMTACQADVDHAVIACALEQFYLDHHAYPARLDELVPAHLDRVPVDLMDGAPTRYRVTPDGRYLLYSIGWNGRDDGGQVAWQKEGARRDNNEGDWVWQYQPLQPPAAIQRSK